MKKISALLLSFLSFCASAQTLHNINKTSGIVSNPIIEIDSIRIDANTNQMVVVTNNGNESHALVEITNVTFSEEQNSGAHSCGAAGVHNSAISNGVLIDQDNIQYKTVVIGTQEWMAENLKTSIYRNGDPILNVSDNVQWSDLASGAWASYNNELLNECPHGKMYNWYAVADPRNICPTGWHVPTNEDWNQMIAFLDPQYNVNALGSQSATAGGELKSLAVFNSPNTGATNQSGFSALPGGNRDIFGLFYSLNQDGFYWSATSIDTIFARYAFLVFDESNIYRYYANKIVGMSVRCVKD
jgi:uncharacterized protein (TIGR02145 family)